MTPVLHGQYDVLRLQITIYDISLVHKLQCHQHLRRIEKHIILHILIVCLYLPEQRATLHILQLEVEGV